MDEGTSLGLLQIPEPNRRPSRTNSEASNVTDVSQNTFGSWLNAEHQMGGQRSSSPLPSPMSPPEDHPIEDIAMELLSSGAVDQPAWLSVPGNDTIRLGSRDSYTSELSGVSTLSMAISDAKLLPKQKAANIHNLGDKQDDTVALDIFGANSGVRGEISGGLAGGGNDDLFGITPHEIQDLLDSKNMELLKNFGGVEGVIGRLRSKVATGISERRDAAREYPWTSCMQIRMNDSELNARRQARLLSVASGETGKAAQTGVSSGGAPAPLLMASSEVPVIVFQEPENFDGAAVISEVSNETLDRVAAIVDHHEEDIGVTVLNFSAENLGSESKADRVDAGFQARRAVFSDNVLPEPKLLSLWDFAKEALKDKTLIILMIAAAADVGVGIYKTAFAEQKDPLGFVDGLAIIIAVVVIVAISALNDFRKQSQFHELKEFSSSLSKVQVLRDGTNIQIKTLELLVGDICNITAGDVIPADGLLIQGFNLSADESAMTGESLAVSKDSVSMPFLYSGTKVVNGVGKMVVVATGKNSANGRLLAALENAEQDDTPLQVKLTHLADLIAKFGTWIAVGMFVGLVILYAVFHHGDSRSVVSIVNDVINLVIIGITLVVVAVPEGLPLAVTISLAHATLKMLADNNLVRHLKACETMGNATTICSDKTGTLTQNRMHVVVGIVACHSFGMENLNPNSSSEEILFRKMSVKSTTIVPSSPTTMSRNELAPRMGDTLRPESRGSSDISNTNSMANILALPEVVVNHIARSINLNTTAEEVVIDPEAHKAAISDIKSTQGPSPSRKSKISLNLSRPDTEFVGSKTEVALLQFTKSKLGRDYKADRESVDVQEVIPFSSDRKRMSTIVRIPPADRDGTLESFMFGNESNPRPKAEKRWLYCKGAAELVIKLCDRYVNADGKVAPLTDSVRSEFESSIDLMASCALRTICIAFKPVKANSVPEVPQIVVNDSPQIESIRDDSNLILAGIVGIRDPIRLEVPQAVADCARAGVIVRMVTGDNMTTAKSIAKLAGICPDLDEDIDEHAVMDGPTFRKLSPEMMDQILPKLRVLARSSPMDKQILVQNLKRIGETVAVTGDGTNDAPALKSADVGFSMGIAGTEMAKEASDIILLDDNFASISKAIVWGRSVYDSVRKFLQFQLTVNIVAVLVTVISSFLTAIFSESRTPISALTAVQLLWVNLIMDTFAALALATDPPTPDLLERPPARKSDALISYDMWKMITVQSIYQTIVCLALYCVRAVWIDGRMDVFEGDTDVFTSSYLLMGTMVFNTFVLCQLFNEVNCRVIGKELNIFKNISKNRLFMLIVGGSLIVQIVIVEFGGAAFKTIRLGWQDWLICLGLGAFSIPLGAIVRLMPDFLKKS